MRPFAQFATLHDLSAGYPTMSEHSPPLHNAAVDGEVDLEQQHLDRANQALVAMRSRAERLLSDLRAAGKPDPDLEAALLRRVAVLGTSRRSLLFGRIDEVGGDDWHIGRRHVEELDDHVLVIDWRADVAMPFYRARRGEPLGLRGRRQIMVEGERVLAVADDIFDAETADVSSTRLRGGDALLRELERSRTGEMLDIVATIQEEQDAIIRGPLSGLVVVQGGPGTGKTAVGLHRAAFLLYNYPDLEHSGVLVIGPSRAFLRYIAQVLPSLGEAAVVQTTISDIAPRVRVRAVDNTNTALVKGDSRMATVLKHALALHRRAMTDAITVSARHIVMTLEPEAVNEIVASIASGDAPYKAGRTALRSRLVALCRRQQRERGRFEADADWFSKELGNSREFVNLLDQLWPSVSPNQLVNALLTNEALLRSAAANILEDDTIAALVRPRTSSLAQVHWTRDDLALLDEANFLINGRTRSYGHIVCDEAQDLSPMQLRMLARRATNGSMTVLGDVAQATGAHIYETWDEALPNLATSEDVRREELTLGFRAPAQILEFASRLLRSAAPSVRPTTSVREGRFSPEAREVAEELLESEAMSAATQLATEGFLVGVILPEGPLITRFEAATRRDANVGRIDRDRITRPMTLVPAPAAKGLEFDAVVVVEPALIAGSDRRGLRLLYVALSRPIHQLVVVHSLPLPSALASPD
jgi:DNA helicase IV